MGVFYPLAAQPYVESLARGDLDRLRRNQRVLVSDTSVVRMGATALGAWLVGSVGIPGAMLVNAVSYLVNAVMLGRITTPDVTLNRPRAPPTSVRDRLRGLVEGLRWALKHPVLGPTTATSTTRNLFRAARIAVLVVFLVGELGAAPWMLSLVLVAGAAGGFAGAQVVGRLIERQRVGSARLYWVLAAWTGPLYLLLPFALPGGACCWPA